MFDFTKTLNDSVKEGIFWCALLAAVIFFLLHLWWGHTGWFLSFWKVALPLAAGGLLFWLGLFNVKTGHRGVLYTFGDRRRRWGPDGLGLTEGYNWVPFPRPLAYVKDEDMREKVLDNTSSQTPKSGSPAGVVEYSKDNARVGVRSTMFWRVRDPYRWQSIDTAQAEQAIRGFAVQGIRDEVAVHMSRKIIKEDKKSLSDKILDRVRDALRLNGTRTDKDTVVDDTTVDITNFLVREVELDDKLNKDLTEGVQVKVRRQNNLYETGTRQKEVKQLMTDPDTGEANGLDARTALAASLADDNVPGVSLQHISIPTDIAEAVKNLARK